MSSNHEQYSSQPLPAERLQSSLESLTARVNERILFPADNSNTGMNYQSLYAGATAPMMTIITKVENELSLPEYRVEDSIHKLMFDKAGNTLRTAYPKFHKFTDRYRFLPDGSVTTLNQDGEWMHMTEQEVAAQADRWHTEETSTTVENQVEPTIGVIKRLGAFAAKLFPQQSR